MQTNSLFNEQMHVACKAGARTVNDIKLMLIKEINFNKWTHVRQIMTFRKGEKMLHKHIKLMFALK